jgi:hypothetical protein
MQTVGSEPTKIDPPTATASVATAERPRSVFGRPRDVSRSDSNPKSRSGSVVFGSGFSDAADRKSPGPGSRSVSRAASMVFGRGDTSVKSRPASPAPALPLPLPLAEPFDVSDVTKQAPGTPGVLPGLSDRRREAWEDDDAEVGQAVWRHEDGRLGVLPSPSVQESVGAGRKGSWIGEPVVTPLEELRGEEDAADAEQSAGRDGANWILPSAAAAAKEDAPAQEATQLEQPAQAVPTTTEPPTADTALPTTLDLAARRSSLEPVKNRDLSSRNNKRGSTSYTLPSPPMARPPPERKFSALDELPSQQRRRQFTPSATPRKMSLVGGEAADPLRSLGATPAYTSQADADQAGHESAVIASPTRQPKTSRPATPSNWEKLSFISPSKKAGDASSRRSSVSSLGNPESHDTIVKSGAASKRHSVIGMLDSSTGEVGAPLDQRRSVSPLPVEPSVTESRGPTFVPYAMPPNGSPQTADFTNRNYQPSQPREQRPVSYMAHSRKSSAVSYQDVVNMQQANKRYSIGGGGVPADYPVPGAVVYQQQPAQPRSRAPSLAPSRAPSLGHPPSEYDRLRSPQPGDADIMVGDTTSRRSSGYFYGPDVSTGALGAIPSPSKIDDNYNALVHPQGPEEAEVVTPLEQPEQQQPQKKRKSGIMDSFRRASSFHSNANNSSRPSSHGSLPLAVVAANNSTEFSLAKTKTLKKPQRAPSSAVEPPKNKRFSTLGSIFRRSSSQASPRVSGPVERQTPSSSQQAVAADTPPRESKKLRKSQPMSSQPQQPQQQQYPQRPPSHYAGPPPGNYAAYEAMMRQQSPPGTSPGQSVPSQYWQQQQQPTSAEPEMMSSPYQQRPAGYYQQGPPPGQYQQHQSSQPNSRTHSLVGSPVAEHSPPSEYYGAASTQPSAVYGQQPTSPSPGQPRPQVRRLHSEGYRRRDTVPGIPEAHSPVNSSGPDGQGAIGVAQVSPQRVVASPARPTVTTRQSSNYSQASVMVSPVASQAPDNFPQAPGRQDYQTQYWQHQHQNQGQPTRGAQALPPLQTQPQPIRQQSGGVGSIDQEVARSPALDYQHHQQAPWSISLPQGAENSSIPNRNSFAQQQAPAQQEQQYRMGPPAAARGAVRSPPPTAPRYQDQYSAMTPYHFVAPQQIQNTPPRNEQRSSSHYGEQVSSPVEYSAPPPQEQAFTPAQHYQNAYGAPRPQQQQRSQSQTTQTRYYGQQQQQGGGGPRPQQQQQYQQQQEALPLSYQRSPSGYSGRRDDAAVSEAELMSMNAHAHMRGASYPGQEWVPGRN